MPREIARVNWESDDISSAEGGMDAIGVVSWAESHPGDVGAALRAVLTGEFDTSNEKDNPSFDDLEARFPREKWLPAFREANAPAFIPSMSSNAGPSFDTKALALRKRLLAGAKREPDNAFWPVALMCWEWNMALRKIGPFKIARVGNGKYIPSPTGNSYPPGPIKSITDDKVLLRRMVAMLLATQHCTRYDDGTWEASYALQGADSQRRGWPLERQLNEFEQSYQGIAADPLDPANGVHVPEAFVTSLQPRFLAWSPINRKPLLPTDSPFLKSLPPRRRMEIGLSLSHLGALVDGAKQRVQVGGIDQVTAANNDRPSAWLLVSGWSLEASSGTSTSNAFIVRARQRGFFDVAQQSQSIASRVAEHNALTARALAHSFDAVGGDGRRYYFEGVDALMPSSAFRLAGYCALLARLALYLAGIWMVFNVLLLQGKGFPSTRPARWWPAAFIGVIVVGFVEWGPSDSPDLIVHWAVSVFAVWLSLLCVTVTTRSHRASLEEAAFDKWKTRILPPRFAVWTASAALWGSLLVIVLGWPVTKILSALIPTPITIPYYGPSKWSEIVLFYAAASLSVALLFWLGSWRWGWKTARPITHGGLRWYKETLGASICILAWAYLFVALAAWPARAHAKQMIQQRWQMGDWAWLQKNL